MCKPGVELERYWKGGTETGKRNSRDKKADKVLGFPNSAYWPREVIKS